MFPSEGNLAQVGYVGSGTDAIADATGGNITAFDLPVTPATALIYGTLKTTLNAPLVGIDMWSSEQSGQAEASGRTYPATADYCIGVRPGSWWVGPNSDALAPLGYICHGASVTMAAGQALRTEAATAPISMTSTKTALSICWSTPSVATRR